MVRTHRAHQKYLQIGIFWESYRPLAVAREVSQIRLILRPDRPATRFWCEYQVSKLANVLHAQELACRLDGSGVTAYSPHPGVIASGVWRRVAWPLRVLMKLRMQSTADGASTSLHCATAPELATESGRYYDACKRREPSKAATPELGAELWRRSAEWVGVSAP